MRYLIITIFLVFSLSGFAQEKTTLSISGSASVSVKPTVTVISLSVSSTQDSYSKAIENLVGRVDQLTKSMMEIGFESKEIITSNFNINKRLKYNQGKQDGELFTAQQQLKVQFKQSKDRLLEVINTATSSQANPELSIAFELDREQKKSLKDKLIKLAIIDARQKADLIAAASGLQVDQIKDISYGPKYYSPNPVNVSYRELAMDAVTVSNMEVSNLTFSETVEMVFLAVEK